MCIPVYTCAPWVCRPYGCHVFLLPSTLTVGGGGPHPHRVVDSGEEDGRRRISMDSDENKYRRKNPMEMLSRWFKLVNVLLIHSQLYIIAQHFVRVALVVASFLAPTSFCHLQAMKGWVVQPGNDAMQWYFNLLQIHTHTHTRTHTHPPQTPSKVEPDNGRVHSPHASLPGVGLPGHVCHGHPHCTDDTGWEGRGRAGPLP